MTDLDRNAERQFVNELLAATRAGRVAWTGSVRPGWHQFIAGEHLLAIGDEGDKVALVVHHVSGHRLETLNPQRFAAEGHDVSPIFAELLELARIQALGLRRRWRQLTKQVASAPGPGGPPGA